MPVAVLLLAAALHLSSAAVVANAAMPVGSHGPSSDITAYPTSPLPLGYDCVLEESLSPGHETIWTIL